MGGLQPQVAARAASSFGRAVTRRVVNLGALAACWRLRWRARTAETALLRAVQGAIHAASRACVSESSVAPRLRCTGASDSASRSDVRAHGGCQRSPRRRVVACGAARRLARLCAPRPRILSAARRARLRLAAAARRGSSLAAAFSGRCGGCASLARFRRQSAARASARRRPGCRRAAVLAHRLGFSGLLPQHGPLRHRGHLLLSPPQPPVYYGQARHDSRAPCTARAVR